MRLGSISVSLLIFTLFAFIALQLFQSTALASSCTAQCPGGTSVTCEGYECTAIDGESCRGHDINGKAVTKGKCYH